MSTSPSSHAKAVTDYEKAQRAYMAFVSKDAGSRSQRLDDLRTTLAATRMPSKPFDVNGVKPFLTKENVEIAVARMRKERLSDAEKARMWTALFKTSSWLCGGLFKAYDDDLLDLLAAVFGPTKEYYEILKLVTDKEEQYEIAEASLSTFLSDAACDLWDIEL